MPPSSHNGRGCDMTSGVKVRLISLGSARSYVGAVVCLTFALAAGLLTVSACSQGEGDVCQIDSDCKSSLECNAGTMRCQRPGFGAVDAGPRFDAQFLPDATIPVDADTTFDADLTLDADLTPDAEPMM